MLKMSSYKSHHLGFISTLFYLAALLCNQTSSNSMAFWGVEVKPGTPYVHQYDDENGRLHISQGTIVPGSSNKRSVVQCTVGDKKPIYLCSLLPEKLETCPLNLDFEEEDEVTFSVVGPHPVHLSGFFYGEDEEQGNPCCDDENDSDSYGEDVMMTDSEDEDDSSYDSEDEDVYAEFGLYPSKTRKSGVTIEEIVDDEKPANEDDSLKQSKKKKNKNENSNSQIVVKSGSDIPILESEDEDGFPKSVSADKSSTLKSASKTGEKDDGSVGVKNTEKKEKGAASLKKLKRKLGALIQDEEPTRDNNVPLESSVHPDSTNPQSEIKQKKNKKKKVEEKEENVTNSDGIVNSPAATNDLNQTSDKKKEKKKNNNQEESVATPNTEEKNSKKGSVEKKEKTNAKAMQVRTYPNGLMIEELAMGKPDGKKASKGKKIGVRYIGKLKKNDKIFDSNIGQKPFKFRLGIGEVISGWDVGVEGMRVGDKRRLTIPPAMGYGARGSPPAIPGNAWLVFDVELLEVN